MNRQDRALRAPLVLTVTVSTVVLLVSVLALWQSAIMALLVRDTAAVQDGEWWRTFTPTLVQPSGALALIFLLVGFVVLVPAVSRKVGSRLAGFGMALGAIGGLALATWLFPEHTGGGSSGAVSALVGMWAICIIGLGGRDWLSCVASAYAGFFASYLLFAVSPLAVFAPLIGNVGAIAAFVLHRHGHTRIVAIGLLTCGAGMTLLLDEHGFGIVLGLLTSQVFRFFRAARPGAAKTIARIAAAMLTTAGLWAMWTVAYRVPLTVTEGVGVRDVDLLSTVVVTGAAMGVATVVSYLTLIRGVRAREVATPRTTGRRASIVRGLYALLGITSCAGPLWLATRASAGAGLISLHLAATMFALTLTSADRLRRHSARAEKILQ